MPQSPSSMNTMKRSSLKIETINLLMNVIALCILLFCVAVCRAETHPESLRCEYLENPLGIDALHPRLSWILESDKRGEKQTAYQVLVASSTEKLSKDEGDLWDSGKVDSDQSILVPYAGKELTSRQQCFWKVRVWDGRGQASPWSEPASWSMGLLKPEDWQAKWIGLEAPAQFAVEDPHRLVKRIWYPGDASPSGSPERMYFRRTVVLPQGRTIQRATLELAAGSSYELCVNGKKTEDMRQEKDLTMDLHSGVNVIAVNVPNAGPAKKPDTAGIGALLRVDFGDGNPLVLVSDRAWRCSKTLAPKWMEVGFDDAAWEAADELGPFGPPPWGLAREYRNLPARNLRTEFQAGKKITRATAYACGLGFFDLYLNGKLVSDGVMNPALSLYNLAAYYLTIDLTGKIKPGANALGAVLGNGRFFAPVRNVTADYGVPRLLLQLELQYEDGTREQIVSDERWRVTDAGPIRGNNEYNGEIYDARREMPGWDQTGFDDSKWLPAQVLRAPTTNLCSQMIEPMRVTEVLKPVEITNPKPGVFIVDFGQNFHGAVRLKASAPKGTTVWMTEAYSLQPDGLLKTADNRAAQATEIYTFKGDGVEQWMPRFRGQGFRRVQVIGFPGTPTVDNFEGMVIHSDVPAVGEFSCSNDLINRIHMAIRWGTRMYLRSAPVDPDRDERQAWLGDPAKDAESEAYNFNVSPFYAKFMDDIRRSQRADGSIPNVVMYWQPGTDVLWPSVYTIIPDWFVDFYGDLKVTETNYETMKRWMAAMQKGQTLKDGTVKGFCYGDWCDAASLKIRTAGDVGVTSRALICTAYHYNNYRIMERAAKRLNKPEDAKFFAEQADRLRTIFNNAFFDPATNTYQSKTQCAYLLPLTFGLVPEEHKQAVIAKLVEDIMVKNEGHLSVGLIGMQWLMQTLTECGQPEVAWTIASQTTRPSWGYMISKGATTIWERWNGDTARPTMNSEALLIQAGNLDAWFYQTLAGINYDREQPGFKHIILRPYPLGDLTWVKAHLDSSYGRIASHWERKGDHFTWNIAVPANTTATVYVPAHSAESVSESGKPASKADGVRFLRMEKDRAVFEIGSGKYCFEAKYT